MPVAVEWGHRDESASRQQVRFMSSVRLLPATIKADGVLFAMKDVLLADFHEHADAFREAVAEFSEELAEGCIAVILREPGERCPPQRRVVRRPDSSTFQAIGEHAGHEQGRVSHAF